MRHRSDFRILTASLALALVLPLAACGEDEPANAPDTQLQTRPADHLIEGTGPPDQVETDPTPQATTGGEIPGYAPAEGDGEDGKDDGEAAPSPGREGPQPAQ